MEKNNIKMLFVVGIIINLINPNQIFSEEIDFYGKNPSAHNVLGKDIIICSDNFENYRSEILHFTNHYKISVPEMYDANSLIEQNSPAESTLAFMGNPFSDTAKRCLIKLKILQSGVDDAINSGKIPQGAIPGVEFTDKDGIQSISKFCIMNFQTSYPPYSSFIGVSIGGLDCTTDIVAGLFSYDRIK